MSNGVIIGPHFSLNVKKNHELQRLGGTPLAYYATTAMQFLTQGNNPQGSSAYPFHPDTHADFSCIPQRWVNGLRRHLGALSGPVNFGTLAGSSAGSLARGVRMRFLNAPGHQCRLDLVVVDGLNARNYGLLSLRDVLNDYHLHTEGAIRFGPNREPLDYPILRLIPNSGFQPVRYACPQCKLSAVGRTGLALVCGDCNRPMGH